MSRHIIAGRNPHHEVVVGWDPMDSGFFIQVFDYSAGTGDDVPETFVEVIRGDKRIALDGLWPMGIDEVLGYAREYADEHLVMEALSQCIDEQKELADPNRIVRHEPPREIAAVDLPPILETKTDALVVPVNLKGVMGAGLAKAVADRWPSIKESYRRALDSKELDVAKPAIVRNKDLDGPRYFMLAPTKRDWKDPSRIEDIDAILPQMRDLCVEWDLKSIAMPGLGTNLGKLDPAVVNPKIRAAFEGCATQVHPYFESVRDRSRAAATKEVRALEPTAFDPFAGDAKPSLFDTPAPRPTLAPGDRYYKNWFSNFIPFETPLIEDGISYGTPEHYFQAAKCARREDKVLMATMSPGQAKRYVRNVPCVPEREDLEWLKGVMNTALTHKFAVGTRAFDQLMSTGREEIVEWNNWNDKRWGRDLASGQGDNILGTLLMELRENYRGRGIQSERTVAPSSQERTERAEEFVVTAIGMSELAPHSELSRLASQSMRRIAAVCEARGLTLVARSGGAPGADTSWERGVVKRKANLPTELATQYRDTPLSMVPKEALEVDPGAKVIVRPGFERTWQRHPKGTYIASQAITAQAATIAEQLHDPGQWENIRPGAQAFLERDVVQYLGLELKRKPDLTLCIAEPNGESVKGGSRIVWDLACGKAINQPSPHYNLMVKEDRGAFLAELREMELVAGIRYDGPELSPEWPTLRINYPLPENHAIDASKRSIVVNAHNIKSLPAERDDSYVYVGRLSERAEEMGLRHVPQLQNDFRVGHEGHQGQCVEMFAYALGDRANRGALATLQGLETVTQVALEQGALNLVCHCKPYECHCDVVTAVVADRLERAGYSVQTPNLSAEQRERFIPRSPLDDLARNTLEHEGFSEVRQLRGPWTSLQGRVIAETEHEVAVETGGGSWRKLSREQAPYLQVGEYVDLNHEGNGGIEANEQRRTREASASERDLARSL